MTAVLHPVTAPVLDIAALRRLHAAACVAFEDSANALRAAEPQEN
ncbi:MAG: hypothetical protein AAB298_09055 [Pseudomonadota bacterium]